MAKGIKKDYLNNKCFLFLSKPTIDKYFSNPITLVQREIIENKLFETSRKIGLMP